MKHFSENYRFRRKSGNDTYSSGWEGHVICVIMTHCVRKSICDTSFKNQLKIYYAIDFHKNSRVIEADFRRKNKNHLRIFKGHFGQIV